MLSIISCYYNKPESLKKFLESLKEQSNKNFELILIDDSSPIPANPILKDFEKLNIKLIKNASNIGQCKSRNIGINNSLGKYIAIVDSDCPISKNFVEEHLNNRNEDEVCYGNFGISISNYQEFKNLEGLSNDEIINRSEMQTRNKNIEFLNLITRNVSFPKKILTNNFYNTEFSYKKDFDENSGFGWEDVDVGCRIKKLEIKIKFLSRCYTAHVTHPAEISDNIKGYLSIKNFIRLLNLHSDILYQPDVEDWTIDTLNKILSWVHNCDDTHLKNYIELKCSKKTENLFRIIYNEKNKKFIPLSIFSLLLYNEPVNIEVVKEDESISEFEDKNKYCYTNIKFKEKNTQDSEYKKIETISAGYIFSDIQKIILENERHQIKNINYVPQKPLKILTHFWHIGHQWELWKYPNAEITILENKHSNQWIYSHRPYPNNIKNKINIDNTPINFKDYDICILHFDENIINPGILTKGILTDYWGIITKTILKQINREIPVILICHGTPPFYGMFDINYNQPNLLQEWKEEKNKIIQFIGDNLVICNSYAAKKQWEFKNCKTIWHGLDVKYYIPTYPKNNEIINVVGDISKRPWYRGYYLYKQINEKIPGYYLGTDNSNTFNSILPKKRPDNDYFKAYLDEINKFSIFLNTTLRSPMPRSRTEGMMLGLATVTTNYHDEEMFINNMIDGFYSNDANEIIDYLKYLKRNPTICEKIGKNGREKAINVFSLDRYHQDWKNLFESIL